MMFYPGGQALLVCWNGGGGEALKTILNSREAFLRFRSCMVLHRSFSNGMRTRSNTQIHATQRRFTLLALHCYHCIPSWLLTARCMGCSMSAIFTVTKRAKFRLDFLLSRQGTRFHGPSLLFFSRSREKRCFSKFLKLEKGI